MASQAKSEVSLNIDELKGFLTHIVTNNRFLQKNKKPPVAVEVVGDSGIGKTSTILQLATELGGLNFIKLNLAQIEEIGDLVGFPIRQFKLALKQVKAEDAKEEPEDKIVWADEHAVQEYIKLGYVFTGHKRMSYCPPEWIADKTGGGILLLDDWNRADIRFIQAVMELIDRQEYISWKLPQDWHIMLTSNPDNGDYLVNSIDSAQRTRFITANLKFDVDCWARWAESVGTDSRCINFLLKHPELVKQETNARSITTFFNSISSFEDFEKEVSMIQMIGEGSVGVEFSTLFTTFIANRLDKLLSPKEILLEENWKNIKADLVNSMGAVGGKSYRADIGSIMATRIINYAVMHAEKGTVNKALIARIIALTTEDIFANDLKYMMVKGILNGNKGKYQELMLNSDIVKMATK